MLMTARLHDPTVGSGAGQTTAATPRVHRVAVLGNLNVGKSTLFGQLVRRRSSGTRPGARVRETLRR